MHNYCIVGLLKVVKMIISVHMYDMIWLTYLQVLVDKRSLVLRFITPYNIRAKSIGVSELLTGIDKCILALYDSIYSFWILHCCCK